MITHDDSCNIHIHTHRFSLSARIIFTFYIASLLYPCFAQEWTRIGLVGVQVTAIACGVNFGQDSVVAAGTKDTGVYCKRGDNTFTLLTDLGSTVQPAGLKSVNTLYMIPQRLFAGSDSGLYVYMFTSGVPPKWTKITDVNVSVSAIAGYGDTLFAATQTLLFRSLDRGTTWSNCTIPFIGSLHPVFTSLAFWRKSINIGSDEWIGGALPWVGVGNSGDFSQTWSDISNLPGQAQPLSSVYSLAGYTPRWDIPARLAAGTALGIYWVEDIDTGTWHPLEPQLSGAKARHLHITNYSESVIAEFFASTDSGMFILSPRINGSNWKNSLKKRVYATASFTKIDPLEWFCAAEDGVYRFTGNVSVIPNQNSFNTHLRLNSTKLFIFMCTNGKIKNPISSPVVLYLPSGKRVAALPPKGVLYKQRSGVYIRRTD